MCHGDTETRFHLFEKPNTLGDSELAELRLCVSVAHFVYFIMAYTVYPDQYHTSEINPKDLKYHYYAQRGPAKGKLVPGMLHQGELPAGRSWMDVTEVDVDLQKRYFVEYTDINTLVPGSLIQADRLPKGQWKEVKPRRNLWHRVVFTDPYQAFFFDLGGPPQLYNFVSQDQFINEKVTAPLNAIYPQIPEYTTHDILYKLPYGKHLHFNLYYFKGTFAQLNHDFSKLVPFSAANKLFLANNIDVPVTNMNIEAWGITLNNLRVQSDLPNGSYCFVLEMTDVSTYGNEYVVLENVFGKTASVVIFPEL